jgi:hypothetical protein
MTSGPQTRTLDVTSPQCGGASGKLCFCGLCNNLGNEPCDDNADCLPNGNSPGICNGKICANGSNHGAACRVASECPGGQCGRFAVNKPNGCADDTTGGPACSPTGECTVGPTDMYCWNHPNRGCTLASDCDGVPGACVSAFRRCHPDEGALGGGVSVAGVATPPTNGVADPTDLGAFTCIGQTFDGWIDFSVGLPGLIRVHQPGRLLFDTAVTDPPPPPPDVCPPLPASSCRSTLRPGSALHLTDRPAPKDQLQWSWRYGSATTGADIGNPAGTEPYALCLYDGTGLRRSYSIPAGGNCGTKPCWQTNPTAYAYRNRSAEPDGITSVDLKAGADGKPRAVVKGKGDLLSIPLLASLTSPLTVQLRNRTTGFCLGTTFVAPFDKLTAEQLKDRAE